MGSKAGWLQLREEAAQCRECPLGERAKQTVWGEGPLRPQLMIVGEQPGDREDLVGRPFVGPAGRLLDSALDDLGWQRSALYLTNAVKHFAYELRGKRRLHKTPGQLEILACEHWLESEIQAVKPAAIIALGRVAATALLGRPIRVLTDRGRWLDRDDGIRVLVTIHPSALLRTDTAARASGYRDWLVDLSNATLLLTRVET